MIDIHCHILPGMDHGPKTVTEALHMARQAAKDGIRKIIATPHVRDDAHFDDIQEILKITEYLNEQLEAENIPVHILPGQETRIYGDIAKDLRRGKILSLNEQTKYISVELTPDDVPPYIGQAIFQIQMSGYIPVISHPETNTFIQENPNHLYEMVKKGAIVQLAAPSVIGVHGKKVQKLTRKLIQAHLVHCIGSNAYNGTKRGFHIKEAMDELTKWNKGISNQLVRNNESIFQGQPIMKQEPERIKAKKWLFI